MGLTIPSRSPWILLFPNLFDLGVPALSEHVRNSIVRPVQSLLRPLFLRRPHRLLGSPVEGYAWSGIVGNRPVDLAPEHSEARDLLTGFLLQSAEVAKRIDFHSLVESRPGCPDGQSMLIWPGEHYRLLAGMARVLGSATVVEIGTYRGAGSLALLAGGNSRVVTYDLIDWRSFPDTMLRESDFGDRLEQRLGNVVLPEVLDRELTTLRDASLVFVDAPKDYSFEYEFQSLVMPRLKSGTILVFDDIRVMNMLEFWASLEYPSIDGSSLGHMTGTGLVLIP